MNKSLAGILGVTVALTLLAGCTAYDRTKDQFTQPVVKDVKKGMSRQQVMQIAGKPSTEVTMVHARGTCQTYILGQRETILFNSELSWRLSLPYTQLINRINRMLPVLPALSGY